MRVSLIKPDSIYDFELPSKIDGTYWITLYDKNNDEKKLISIFEEDNVWKMQSNSEISIMGNNNEVIDKVKVSYYTYYFLNHITEGLIILYTTPIFDPTFTRYLIEGNVQITIGKSPDNIITYNNNYINDVHAKITRMENVWRLEDLNTQVGTYVNNKKVTTTDLKNGDVIFIMGLRLVVCGNIITINNPLNLVNINYPFNKIDVKYPEIEYKEEQDIQYYEENDYFLSQPRFKSNIKKINLKIDKPPASQDQEEMPILYTLGPMITMGMTSMVTASTTIMNVMNNGASITSAIPTLVISGAMLMSMILWPSLQRRWQKRQKKKKEKYRRDKYTNYIESKRHFIENTMITQKQILMDNNISLEECESIIFNKKRTLWERKIDQEDFLTLRLGLGDLPVNMDIEYPKEEFTLEEDDLRDVVDNLVNDSKIIRHVPVNFSFTKKYIAGIIGKDKKLIDFMKGLILQMVTFHGYDKLKLVFLTSEKNKSNWEFSRVLPHTWNDNKTLRYLASNSEDIKELSEYLLAVIHARKYKEDNGGKQINTNDYKSYSPYYVIVTDNFRKLRDLEFIKELLSCKVNVGFSLIILDEKLSNLPNECVNFIDINDNKVNSIFESDLFSENQQKFTADVNPSLKLEECAHMLANIPIEFDEQKNLMPDSVSFLTMYNVGKIEQLNVLNRWKSSNPIKTLQAPVGIDKMGELLKLDLHEKFHGPHGLVAGMTGSGKSEFIITYVLSMAVNYSPEEVAFVLIDYKGGGLAGAFENRETGLKLPHLAGTITNLDTNEMNRSLASIQSELKRRQKCFGEAREKLGESTIDIYKYQRFYREGKVAEPMPHLFIICDEFAELKTQQSEFMAQLISAARIGRSLGVHLILATQKPSGVVDAQIWSNTKFRVCLKVQDKSDSNEMIKMPDAAALKEVGRFYLQVGYNEFLTMGQSAWCGAKYAPKDVIKKLEDKSVVFVNDIGSPIKNIDEEIKNINYQGEELTNVVTYVMNLAKRENLFAKKLWLDKIPEFVYINELRQKYSYKEKPFNLNILIGEYDDPNNQRQGLLTLPLSSDGNVIIYGSSGSGKDDLLSTIVYSTMTGYSVDEVNIYILDYGAEVLRTFNGAPHVGDILLSGDDEKVHNLFKMLKNMIDERKELFVEYNGSYELYVKKSGNSVPNVVVIINNYEAFSEMYVNEDEELIRLSREGLKYGIVFILTTSSVNGVKYRLKANFNQNIALQMNDQSDYNSILGNVRRMAPSKYSGRGLIKKGDIYEFQTALPYKKEQVGDYIKSTIKNLRNNTNKEAIHIPVLPKTVTIKSLRNSLRDLSSFPIGVEKNSLQISKFDLIANYISLICAESIDNLKSFVPAVVKLILNLQNVGIVMLDAEGLMKDYNFNNLSYYSSNFDGIFKSLYDFVEKQKNLDNYQNKQMLCVIVGINKLRDKLNEENKGNFENFINDGKNVDKFNIILIDTISNLKAKEYDSWFKNNVSVNNAIWVGSGINEQYTIKLTRTPMNTKEVIDNTFGYCVKKGNATLVKLVEYNKNDEMGY